MPKEASMAMGFATPFPAMSGADPCTGSYIALRFLVLPSSSPREAEGNMPSEPVSMAATSESMSPNRLSVTMTSNCFGQRTSCMPPASASWCSSTTSLNSRACSAPTTSCQSTPVFITLRFSMDVTLLRRLRASSKATRAMRSISDRRPDIGEQPEILAQPQEPGLRAHVVSHLIPFRPAHRTEDHRVGSVRLDHGLVADRHLVGVVTGAA